DGLRQLPLLQILMRRVQMFCLVIGHLQTLIEPSRAGRVRTDGSRFALVWRGFFRLKPQVLSSRSSHRPAGNPDEQAQNLRKHATKSEVNATDRKAFEPVIMYFWPLGSVLGS